MVGSAQARRPVIHCDQTDSVLSAIEASWNEHNAKKPGLFLGLYAALAVTLNEKGVIIDTLDGLEILEHCRRRNLQIVDILHVLEERVRRAGYRGDSLTLADFNVDGKPVYAFYDGSRFKTFGELKQKTQMRIAGTKPEELRPEA